VDPDRLSGYSRAVIDAATAHSAAFSITCGNDKRVRGAIYELVTSTETTWVPALSLAPISITGN